MKRYGILALLAFWVGGSGCATSARRDDLFSSGKNRAWAQAPAPTQVEVPAATPADRVDGSIVASSAPAAGTRAEGEGLSRYFPNLRRNQADPVKVASAPRASWFGLRKPKVSQVYTTDARVDWNRKPFEPSLLPVALQIPTDRAVTPTSAETPAASTGDAPAASASAALEIPAGSIGTEPKPVTTDVAAPTPSLPVAGVPSRNGLGMPEVPPVDPRERPRMAAVGASLLETTASAPAPAPAPTPAEPKADAEAGAPRDGDSKAVQAITPAASPTNPLGLPEVTLPAAYFRHETMAVPSPTRPSTQGPVYASPQIQPTPQAKPSPQAHPSPQSGVKPVAAVKGWKQNCVCRTFRKICKIGEFAKP